MNHAQELRNAYAEKESLLSAGNPSSPLHGLYSDEEWLDAYSEVQSKIYALEESLAALSP